MTSLGRWFPVAAAAILAGCGSPSYNVRGTSWPGLVTYRMAASREPQPRLGLSDAEVARALAERQGRTAAGADAAQACVASVRDGDVAEVASAIRTCYALGAREVAGPLLAREGVRTFDASDGPVQVECRYRAVSEGLQGALEVTVTRKAGVTGPLVVAFPPGTYGIAADGGGPAGGGRPWIDPDDDRRYGHWPSAQDLAFLRAPVIILPASEESSTFTVQVACASFHKGSPHEDRVYTLHRFEPGTPIDRLLVALCARETVPEAESQLAVWMARDNLAWADFEGEGGGRGRLVTFGSAWRILPRHACGAANLLMEAGVNPRQARFFADVEPALSRQEAPQEAQPAVEPGSGSAAP
jgi:hypothetical protein